MKRTRGCAVVFIFGWSTCITVLIAEVLPQSFERMIIKDGNILSNIEIAANFLSKAKKSTKQERIRTFAHTMCQNTQRPTRLRNKTKKNNE